MFLNKKKKKKVKEHLYYLESLWDLKDLSTSLWTQVSRRYRGEEKKGAGQHERDALDGRTF